ncbi:hypothetical protein BV20DRAFT_971096 [Pilatotrama ljubarskyi]|nr:hypothetical protein BV20DRAFT_971096 [Pilatotrama ljubarskyi]
MADFSSSAGLVKRLTPPSPSSSAPDNRASKRQRLEKDEDPQEDIPDPQIATTGAVAEDCGQPGLDHVPVADTVHSHALPSALKIIKALQEVEELPQIGHCPTKVYENTRKMLEYSFREDKITKDDVETDSLSPETFDRVERNAERVDRLGSLMKEWGRNVASGFLDREFSLSIARPGCEFVGSIHPEPGSSRVSYQWKNTGERMREARLKQWYDSAAMSGYGDVLEQTTKINSHVRNAREINSSEFRVEPELLRRIEALWEEHFIPSTNVRAEPYKIHLYGPDGHFKEHRDTPQKDLVGTFLIGLGDTSYYGGLVVDGKHMHALCGHWCAFYPDVRHRVKEVVDGYRAVIAFKIFRASNDGGQTEKMSAMVPLQIRDIIKEMEAPYGILLEHKYCLGTEHFTGFDAMIVESVRALEDVDVHHMPVVVTAFSEWGTEERDMSHFKMSCETSVYPFASGYIDALQGRKRSSRGLSHESCGCPWLEGVEEIPFFSLDLRRSTVNYKEEEEETCNYVGNEAQAWREDSVYLSYALIVLPKPDSDSETEDGSTGEEDGPSAESDASSGNEAAQN